jgi:hypothetical protein
MEFLDRTMDVRRLNEPLDGGTPGWWLNSVVFRRSQMGRFQLKFFDMMVPVLRLIDGSLPTSGLSLIAVAEAR